MLYVIQQGAPESRVEAKRHSERVFTWASAFRTAPSFIKGFACLAARDRNFLSE